MLQLQCKDHLSVASSSTAAVIFKDLITLEADSCASAFPVIAHLVISLVTQPALAPVLAFLPFSCVVKPWVSCSHAVAVMCIERALKMHKEAGFL